MVSTVVKIRHNLMSECTFNVFFASNIAVAGVTCRRKDLCFGDGGELKYYI